MKAQKGFSLIELLVVIAIVGLLSAIAIPAYNRYIASAKLGALVTILDGLVQKSITYASVHGYYPSAAAIISNSAGPTIVTSGNVNTSVWGGAISTNSPISFIHAGDFSQQLGASQPCGMAGEVAFTINGPQVGLPNTGFIVINCLLAHKKNVVDTQCYYTYNETISGHYVYTLGLIPFATSAGTADILPGVTNAKNNFPTLARDFFNGATCM